MKRCHRRFIFRWSIRFSRKAGLCSSGTILGAGSIFITYWKTGDTLLLYCAIAVLLVAALRGLVDVRLFSARGRPSRPSKRRAAGNTLRRRRGNLDRAARPVVLSRLRANLRSFYAACQFLDDDCVYDRNFRTKLRQRALCSDTDLLRLDADNRGAVDLRQLVSLDLRRPAGPHLSGIKFIADRLRSTLLDAVVILARHVAPRQALRHGDQQHAARSLHVRLQAPGRRFERQAEAAARARARSRAEGPVRARGGRGHHQGRIAVGDRRAKHDRSPRRAACRRRRFRLRPGPDERAHARIHRPADGERRHGGVDRGHHRAQDRRGKDQSSGALRCA